jgi:shikimate dehydrogenase
MQIAEEAGCRTENGLSMLLYQGAEAFRIWTGRDMPVDYVKSQVF